MSTASRDPMRITPVGPAAAATVAFRAGGQLRVTAIVKASFTFAPDAPMTIAAPVPVVRSDEPYAGKPPRSIASAQETAPYLGRTDVLVAGRAAAPGGRAVPELPVRLIVARDGQPLLEKRLVVRGPRDPAGNITPIAGQAIVYEYAVGGPASPENPAGVVDPARARVIYPEYPGRTAGFGAVARSWPVRQQILGSFDSRALDQRIATIPDGFPWGYYQSAPPDQRIAALRGDEWVILEGFHADRPRLQSRLPGARGVAKLYGPSGAFVAGVAVSLVGDMLIIDAERRICSVVWRGSFPVSGEEALASMDLFAGVELPGQAVAFPSSYNVTAAQHADPLSSTVAGPPPSARPGAAGALPFHPRSAPPSPSSPPSDPLSATMAASPPRPHAGGESALPFHAHAAGDVSPFAIPHGDFSAPPAHDPLGSTMAISGPSPFAAPATPFERPAPVRASPSSPPKEGSKATVALSLEEIARGGAAPALPFADARPGTAPLPPMVARPQATPFDRGATPRSPASVPPPAFAAPAIVSPPLAAAPLPATAPLPNMPAPIGGTPLPFSPSQAATSPFAPPATSPFPPSALAAAPLPATAPLPSMPAAAPIGGALPASALYQETPAAREDPDPPFESPPQPEVELAGAPAEEVKPPPPPGPIGSSFLAAVNTAPPEGPPLTR